MREIKFRAWDKDYKKFYYFGLFDLDENYSYVDCAMVDEECPVDQYTGLKDKNGKEIYGGDIVRGIKSEQNGKNAYEITDTVNLSPGGFILFGKPMQDFTWLDGQIIRDIYWVDSGHLNVPDIFWKIIEIEVIGNIYENPELLDKA